MSIDKRVIKTRNSIKTAFMQLTMEREKEKITVSDIAEKAVINRSTFYLHYKDVISVINDIEKEIAAKISACIESFDTGDLYGSTYAMFTSITAMFDEEEALKKYIVFSKDSQNVSGRLKEIIIEKVTTAISEDFEGVKKSSAFFPITFAAAGIVETYISWERTGGNDKPFNEITDEVSKYTEYIIKSITSGRS